MPHDRTGERIEEDDVDVDTAAVTAARHRRYCSGWIDPDADRPIPCLVCKPHLARTVTDEREQART